jgi:hypothetical protein
MPVKARFIAPMLLFKTDALPNDATRWDYQLTLDGYRTIAFKTGGTTLFLKPESIRLSALSVLRKHDGHVGGVGRWAPGTR